MRNFDRGNDLALVGADAVGPAVRVRGSRLGVGESVAVTGFPLRGVLSGFNMTTGIISSMSGLGGDTRYFQLTAPVQLGNSGGPMLLKNLAPESDLNRGRCIGTPSCHSMSR